MLSMMKLKPHHPADSLGYPPDPTSPLTVRAEPLEKSDLSEPLSPREDSLDSSYPNKGGSIDDQHDIYGDCGDNGFKCEHCNSVFTDASNLQRHIRTNHVGARSHTCTDCGKSFSTSSGLKQHQHIHSSVKPFQCEVCLKAYTQFSNLCRHKRMHADCRQQIKCRDCGQAFSTVTSLSKHKRFCEGVLRSGAAAPRFGLAAPTAASPFKESAPPISPQLQANMTAAYMQMYGPRQPFPFYPPFASPFPMFPAGHPFATMVPGFPAPQLDHARNVTAGNDVTDGKDTDSLSPEMLDKRSSTPSEPESDVTDDLSGADEMDTSSSEKMATSPADELPVSHASVIRSTTEATDTAERISRASLFPIFPCFKPEAKKPLSALPNGEKSPPLRLSPAKADPATKVKDDKAEAPLDLSIKHKEQQLSPLYRSLLRPASPEQPSPPPKAGFSPYKPVTSPPMPLKKRLLEESGSAIASEASSPDATPEKKQRLHVAYPIPSLAPGLSANAMELALSNLQRDKLGAFHPSFRDFALRMPQFAAASGAAAAAFPPLHFPPPPPPAPPGGLDSAKLLHGNQLLAAQLAAGSQPRLPFQYPAMSQMGPGQKARDRYSCKFCGKVFPRSANLTRHLRTHTGEQPYKCKYCERSFSISSNLQRHVRNIHNKEKPYRCPLCDRSFGQQTNLDRHLKKHETDGPNVVDSPPAAQSGDEGNLDSKDESYFAEIRNFIYRATDDPASVARATTKEGVVNGVASQPPVSANFSMTSEVEDKMAEDEEECLDDTGSDNNNTSPLKPNEPQNAILNGVVHHDNDGES